MRGGGGQAALDEGLVAAEGALLGGCSLVVGMHPDEVTRARAHTHTHVRAHTHTHTPFR